jgi:hypothetical protein
VKKITVLFICFCLAAAVDAQKTATPNQKRNEKKKKIDVRIRQEEEGELYFKKQSVFGLRANSDGYGIYYEHGKFKSPRKINFYSIGLNEKKHPKEERQSPVFAFGNSNSFPFIYGKLNNFYQFKLGVGQEKIFGGKSNKNGVSVAALYEGGVSIGLLRPYTLTIYDTATLQPRKITYSKEDEFYFSEPLLILSGPSIGDGWNKLKFKPGVHAKLGLRFDYGRFNESVTAIDIGVNAEYYFGKVPQMLLNKEKSFFLNFYAAILFGGRK